MPDKFGACLGSATRMLAPAQWAWLEAELELEAEVTVIVSGIQVSGHWRTAGILRPDWRRAGHVTSSLRPGAAAHQPGHAAAEQLLRPRQPQPRGRGRDQHLPGGRGAAGRGRGLEVGAAAGLGELGRGPAAEGEAARPGAEDNE